MAAATSSSVTLITSCTSLQIQAKASASGKRQAKPSANTVLTGASSTRPARNESW